MSQQLWLYEGLTEYAAHHVQIKNGKMTLDDFLNVMRQKMITAGSRYNDELSFTEMSKGCLDKYEQEYGNVYQKGALIAMCLDIQLRQLSNGSYGTQELMRDLSKYYGKDKSFQDDSLFAVITRMTYPEIGEFFKKYVVGHEPLPFQEMMNLVGIKYKRKETYIGLAPFGGYGVVVNEDLNLILVADEPNAFGSEMGYQEGDQLISLNGKRVNLKNAEDVIGSFINKATSKPNSKLKVKVRRKMPDGSYKNYRLKGRIHPVEVTRRHVMNTIEDPTPQQEKIRKAWINR
jgi:predicted metalloprotease with PDZ domain